MIRTKRKGRKSPPVADTEVGIAAKVTEWPPGEIMNQDLENLDSALDMLKDNVCWLKDCAVIHPVIQADAGLVEIAGTVHNLISNINEANQILAAIYEAGEEESGDGQSASISPSFCRCISH